MRVWCRVWFVLLLMLVVAGCPKEGGGTASGKPVVVSSIFPVHDLVRRIGGEAVQAEVLLKPGQSAHNFNPSAKLAKTVARSKAAFIVGLSLDGWASKTVEAAGSQIPIVKLGERVKSETFKVNRLGAHAHAPEQPAHPEHGHDHGEHDHEKGGDHSHGDTHGDGDHKHDEAGGHDHEKGDDHKHAKGAEHGHEKGHDHEKGHGHEKGDSHKPEKGHDHKPEKGHDHEKDDGHGDHDEHGHEGHHHADGPDPHVWMSVAKAIAMVDIIEQELSKVLPDNQSVFSANASKLKEELKKLHQDIAAKVKTFKNRRLVTFHGSFGYFAAEYGLDIVAVIEPFPGKQPSAAYLKEVLSALKDKQVAALYTEPQLDARPAKVLADEAKLPLKQLDPLGGVADRDSYEKLMRFNLAQLAESMG